MNKTDLVSQVAETSGLTKATADAAVDAVFAAIADALKSGDDVRLVGFGTFSVSARAAREGKIPHGREDCHSRQQGPEILGRQSP